MSISITNESKNEITITNEGKSVGVTWDEATFPWSDADRTWDLPDPLSITNESKNTLSISNESKT